MSAVMEPKPKMKAVTFEEAKGYLFNELVEVHHDNAIYRFFPDAKVFTLKAEWQKGSWYVYA